MLEKINPEDKLTLKLLAEKLNEVIEHLNSVPSPQSQARNRGPSSERVMTDEDAYRILSGDLKDIGHREAAEVLKLSYGQIYSCRKCFTFKHVHHALKQQA
jgi:hypothetical protein